jgi:hypothetical protein
MEMVLRTKKAHPAPENGVLRTPAKRGGERMGPFHPTLMTTFPKCAPDAW